MRAMGNGGDLCPVVGERGAHDQVEEGREEEEEVRGVSAPPIPVTPTREEVEKHRLTHRPFSLLVPALCAWQESGR